MTQEFDKVCKNPHCKRGFKAKKRTKEFCSQDCKQHYHTTIHKKLLERFDGDIEELFK